MKLLKSFHLDIRLIYQLIEKGKKKQLNKILKLL